jgi:hypothetical protein
MFEYKKDGGPAFPNVYQQFDRSGEPQGNVVIAGMSLRDYFAASALPGLIEQLFMCGQKDVSEAAYKYADAMLAARLAASAASESHVTGHTSLS